MNGRSGFARALALLTLLLLSFLAVEPASAQGGRRFDAMKELEEWRQYFLPTPQVLSVVFNPDMKEIASRDGDVVTPAERQELHERWERLRPVLAERERRFHEDPKYQGQVLARYRVTKFRPFREIEPEIRDDEPPFLLVLQRTGDRGKDLTKHEVNRYVVHGRELLEHFNKLILWALGREIPPENSTFVLAVMADQKRYLGYANALQDRGLYWSRAHYDPERRFAVTFPTRKNFDPEAYHALRHELVHAAMHAARTAPGSSRDVWLDEGLAEFLASGLAKNQDRSEAVKDRARLREWGLDPERSLELLPIVDLVAAQGYGDVLERVRRRLGGPSVSPTALGLFYSEAHLFNEFLYSAGEGRYRARYLKVIGSNLDGRGGPSAFHEAFEGVDLDTLQREFFTWIDPELASLELPPTPEALERTAVEAAAEESMAPCGQFDPEALRALVEAPPVALGRALLACRAGAAEEAAELLEQALARAKPGDARERLERERARVKAWSELRDRYLAFLAKGGKKLDIELKGERVRATVKSFEAGVLTLEANERGTLQIEVSSIPAFTLAAAMGKHRKQVDAGWVRIYPYALAGDSRWQALLRNASTPEEVALREDAAGFSAEQARSRALEPLASLLGRGTPGDAAEARPLLDDIRAALAAGGDRLPDGVREVLRPLACNALETLYLEEDPLDGLAGEVERLDGGRIRITYPFKDSDELQDFVRGPDPTGILDMFGGAETKDSLEVADGSLVASGSVARRHLLRFSGPIRVSYSLTSRGEEIPFALVGGFGSGRGRFAACLGPGGLIVSDPRSGLQPRDIELPGESGGRIDLAFDGEGQVELSMNGERVSGQSCGSLRVFGFFLAARTDTGLCVDDLVLEGVPEAETLEPLRQRAVARGLEELGM